MVRVSEEIPLAISVSGSGEKDINFPSAKTQITHDASVQRDHSDLIVYVTVQITLWMRPNPRLNDKPHVQSALTFPSEWKNQNFDNVSSVDQCSYLWIYIPAVLVFLLNLYVFHNEYKLIVRC